MEIRLLASADTALLDRVAPDVFDEPLQPALVAEFLADHRHHLVVAIDQGVVIGFASAVHYVHPDKARRSSQRSSTTAGAWAAARRGC